MYCFSKDFPQNVTRNEVGIQEANTIPDWFNFCREDIGRYLDRHGTEIGGTDLNNEPVVEIDELKYFNRKYDRGAWHPGNWVFGGIERVSRKCFLMEVPDRTAQTLEAAILDHILPGTHIISDGWASYRNVSQLGGGIYEHSIVVHVEHFVDPDDNEVHTQNIENL